MVYLDCWPPQNPPFGPALACPWDADPTAYDWRILAGLDVLLKVPRPAMASACAGCWRN
jgi:hypothetical protein